ncbi:SDR family NAD(P)-dependent oxidoreductase [Nocardia sp. NPDC004278]
MTSHEKPEPIAIIGISCRLPQAADKDAFWRLLMTSRNAVTTAPEDRFNAHADRNTVKYGGFLDTVDEFDPEFFGISPREAVAMDPQQRIVLELVWEAFEDAAIIPATLAGSSTGVFLGAVWDDYATLLYGSDEISAHAMTGLHRSIIANRVSYTLGLRGPSMVVDAAQASSLVAVHLACASLRRGESNLAVAGGVNLNLIPQSNEVSARFGGLSPDGRCYTFDARANGYVRGEGAGTVILKPLTQAVADGDSIYCVIRGSATNNDGLTDALTVPSARAQAEVIRAAYDFAGIDCGDTQYVELHGTGTKVGDPVEAAALGAALATARTPSRPLVVGSVKTNIGHLEGAAGVSGLIKTALSIRHRRIPASLNFLTPNPEIDFRGLNLRVQQEPGPWPEPERPLIAGVSSFGMGGTNCHVVLAEPPASISETLPATAPCTPVLPWVLSAHTERALRAQADRLREHLIDHPEASAHAVGWSLATSRTAFHHRAVVYGADRHELVSGLEAFVEGGGANLAVGRSDISGVVFVFPGQGSQWHGMAVDLLESSEQFRTAFAECAEALAPHIDWSPTAVLRGEPGAPALDRVDVVQPMLFAVMVALARMWQSFGIEPTAVIGHSQGEIAAAHVAGALSLADAASIVALRSRALADIAGEGAMAAIALSETEAEARISKWTGRLAIAAVNGPSAVVVAGDPTAMAEFVSGCGIDDIRARIIPVDYASHTSQVESVQERLRSDLTIITPQSTATDFYSTVTGQRLDTGQLDSDYWYTNLRNPVRFAEAVREAASAGNGAFIEMSPHPVLTFSVEQTLADSATASVVVSSLKRDQPSWWSLIASMATLFTRGITPRWAAVFGAADIARVPLPHYAFQRTRYWPGIAPQVSPGVGSPWRARLMSLHESAQHDLLVELVRSHVVTVLGSVAPASLDPETSFETIGFESSTAVDLRNRLAAATGAALPASLLFDQPTVAKLAAHLRDIVLGLSADQRPVPQLAIGLARDDDPVAIVGVGCRFPGGISSAEQLWDVVADGRDVIGRFPTDRGWDLNTLFDPELGASGHSNARGGGFLYKATQFDAAFFGISPREAAAMDPQQRVLLEVSWEALENAGVNPKSLRGSDTGVFVGVFGSSVAQYGATVSGSVDAAAGYRLTGGAASVVSGRVSYVLGLEGPAVSVDTACSSSLVAIHQAVAALRAGECAMALAGGVTVMATPGLFIEFSRQGGLSADGRCRSFADSADGTGWSEGAGVVVLERLSDARRLGHEVLAVVRGSAVNQDGASNGLTAPNGPSQQRVIRAALANAGLTPADVDVVEAHGTGTRLGDPIEAQAVIATYGQRDPDAEPVWLGSLKSNIGHTQAAAGVAGLIKMTQALRRKVLPATLHVDSPSSQVDWSAGNVGLLIEQRLWPDLGRARRGAVSSFGISGTNAHVIVEQAPLETTPESAAPAHGLFHGGVADVGSTPLAAAQHVLVLSGRVPAAVRAAATDLIDLLETGADPRDVAFSLAQRSVFEHRAVVIGQGREQVVTGLRTLARGAAAPGVVEGATAAGQTAWLFTGQGSQRVGMGRELYEASPVFAATIDEICGHLDVLLGGSLREVMFTDDSGVLDSTMWTQSALFAVEVGLAALLRAWGVEPQMVVGHSVGGLAAAHVAGVMSLADACAVVAARGRLMQMVSEGAMVALAASEAETLALLSDHAHSDVSLAAVNGAESVVISGDPDALAIVVAQFEGRRVRWLQVNRAFHSTHMAPVVDQLQRVLDGVTLSMPRIPVISDSTGELLTAEQATSPRYWAEHVRLPVRFAAAVESLRASGVARCVELGPDPVLTAMLGGAAPASVGLLRAGRSEIDTMLEGLAHLHVHGHSVGWSKLLPAGRRIPLPTYPFQRSHYWSPATDVALDPGALGQESVEHAIISALVELPDSAGHVFTGLITAHAPAWVREHIVHGTVVLPGAAYMDMILSIGALVGCDRVDELTHYEFMPIPERGALRIRVVVEPADIAGRREFAVYSRSAMAPPDADWTRHAGGLLSAGTAEPNFDLREWPPVGATPLDVTEFYRDAVGAGLWYGPNFRGLQQVWSIGDTRYAEVSLGGGASPNGYGIHPALLDSLLHPSALVPAERPRALDVRVPFSWGGVRLHATRAVRARVAITPLSANEIRLEVADEHGHPVMTVDSLMLRVATPAQTAPATSIVPSLGHTEIPSGQHPGATTLLMVNWIPAPTQRVLPEWPGRAVFDARDVTAVGVDPSRAHALAADALAAVQAALGRDGLTVVTRSAVSVAGEPVTDPAAAVVWGLVRSAQAEDPGRFVLVDLDIDAPESSPEFSDAITDALGIGEPQIAVRGGVTYVARMVEESSRRTLALPPSGTAWRLGVIERGTVDGVGLLVDKSDTDQPLNSGQVRVAVRAAGLNFRDVMISLGMRPDGEVMGSEIAGVVLEVGPAVIGLSVGDRVMGLVAGAIGPIAVADRRLLTAVPAGWSLVDAAAAPVVYLTAYHGLRDVADVREGQRLLVHAAAGGVGTAAVALARHWGLEVFATASTGKWDVLRRDGFDDEHLADSRTVQFEDTFGVSSEARGMDVVLNSLTGEFIDASLRLLPRGGHFVEIGKADIRSAADIARAYPGVIYQAFDLLNVGPDRIAGMLDELGKMFAAGVLPRLPVRTWPVTLAHEALRHFSQARHVGKIVLTIAEEMTSALARSAIARVEGTVVITGGTGGLGIALARHLAVTHHVRSLILTSRRGEAAEGVAELVDELAVTGTAVQVVACDITDSRAVDQLLQSVPGEHPLAGVVHAAGVLDDGTIAALTAERLDGVLEPKVEGSWYLHEATKHRDLQFFVMFSSLAGVIGAAGQANYAAANAFLDALAQYRRSQGMPATAIAWGLWESPSGMTGQLDRTAIERWARSGFVELPIEEALAQFDAAVIQDRAAVVATRLDMAALATAAESATIQPLLRDLAPASKECAIAAPLARSLATLDAVQRPQAVLEMVRTEVAVVLGHNDTHSLGLDRNFRDLGIDSLTAVEIRNRINATAGLHLPPTLVFDYPTPSALAAHIESALRTDEREPASTHDPRVTIGEAIEVLEMALSGTEWDRDSHTSVENALRELLASWARTHSGELGDTPADDLAAVDEDELFDILDRELEL